MEISLNQRITMVQEWSINDDDVNSTDTYQCYLNSEPIAKHDAEVDDPQPGTSGTSSNTSPTSRSSDSE